MPNTDRMALRDQPYLPLYIQDFLTDEKLMECSAAATGVYIRIMCLMHKSDPYGTILLRQKDKQIGELIPDFAAKLARHFPYPLEIILLAIGELLAEKCLFIEGDYLVQKRMVKDGKLSLTRSKTGSLGGEITKEKHKIFALAKPAANTESEDLLRIIIQLESKNNLKIAETEKSYFMHLVVEMVKIFTDANPQYFFDKEADYSAALQIAYHIGEIKKIKKSELVNGKMPQCLESWKTIVKFIKGDEWLATRSLSDLSTVKEWQRLVQKMNAEKKEKDPTKVKIKLD